MSKVNTPLAIYGQLVLRSHEELFETRPDGILYQGRLCGWDSIGKVDVFAPSVASRALVFALSLGTVLLTPTVNLWLSDGLPMYFSQDGVAELDESGGVLRWGRGVFRELVQLLEAEAPKGTFQVRFRRRGPR